MSKPGRLSGEEVIRKPEKIGFSKIRQKGSHIILKKETSEGTIGCVVPMHSELAVGTLRGILRQAKVTPDEFLNID
ncbi:MAG: type II toxin-antitoxin system HicA family toxin [Candidatus Jordarchaeum sp.]|uniref:type II toxin-antitoxin system HicA family toxin n=1 Tax=Candidatus Jordarchaeum sp. TaxID=2823881 RepID=UPI004049FD67